jgi:dTMP kinase
MRGLFITFEGVEGSGKSTQLQGLAAHLKARGLDVIVTREPGGTPIAEDIRAVLLDPAHAAMGTMTELLLYAAARAQHLHELIQPALAAGKVVLCDRFADSTTAYQGGGRGVSRETLATLHALATGGLQPDLTLLLDVSAEEGLARARTRGRTDRLEQESVAFHTRVRDAYLKLAAQDPARMRVIDGRGEVADVAVAVQAAVDALLDTHGL